MADTVNLRTDKLGYITLLLDCRVIGPVRATTKNVTTSPNVNSPYVLYISLRKSIEPSIPSIR